MHWNCSSVFLHFVLQCVTRLDSQTLSTFLRNSHLTLSGQWRMQHRPIHFAKSTLYDFARFGFCFRSFKSLLRPKACLFATRSSREMKCTGTPKKVLATLFPHASGNSTPVISVKTSIRTGAIPI